MSETSQGVQAGRWTRRQRDLAVCLWVSFLAACAGTFVLFALVDPEALTAAWVPGWELGLRLVYGLGFAFLFLVSLLASVLTAYMIRTGPPPGHARRPPPTVRDPAELNPDLKDEEWQ
ncbi:MAG: hypothetical protein P8008_03540 [Gammaproteobacteria bacterium]